jgi:glycerol-3-phosphate dehydrogenase
VINATGVYADAVRHFDEPDSAPILSPSQGIHLVLDADFLPGQHALMIPKTEDGRVMFAIPWHGKLLLGTTDTERDDLPEEPQPFAEEIDFLLRTAGRVLKRPPQRSDIRSAFAGLRPLLHPKKSAGKSASRSREHAVLTSASGLLTVSGGKWTTYRLMAEQVVDRAVQIAELGSVACRTAQLRLHGWSDGFDATVYGSDAPLIAKLPGHDHRLHPALTLSEAEVRFAVRFEAARTIEDILARRNRSLFLDASAAAECIEPVGRILAEELGLDGIHLAVLVAQAERSARHCLLVDS